MAEGGHSEELGRSVLMGSEDGDLSRSVMMGSQDVHEYYCEPCDEHDIHIEATFYCRKCKEYTCKKCSMSHINVRQSRDHDIVDVQHMTHKPPVSKKGPRAITMATHVKDIQVKGHIISSAFMSTNQLLVADYNNNTVRLVDTSSGSQVSELELSGWPRQVTRISDTEAAVTLPNGQKIVLLITQPQLSVVREISVQGWCCGIAYMDNKLIVTFSKGHVDILDMSGKVLRTISDDQAGKSTSILTLPYFVIVNPVTSSMYVTDWVEREKSRLVKLSMKGRVEATCTYTTDEDSPCQVALDSQGMVYVPGCKTSRMFGRISLCVDQLSANCEKLRTIIPDLASPAEALSYDKATHQLYVGHSDGVVNVYKLS